MHPPYTYILPTRPGNLRLILSILNYNFLITPIEKLSSAFLKNSQSILRSYTHTHTQRRQYYTLRRLLSETSYNLSPTLHHATHLQHLAYNLRSAAPVSTDGSTTTTYQVHISIASRRNKHTYFRQQQSRMADYEIPSGPPPPKVPEGWVARWNDQYHEWW